MTTPPSARTRPGISILYLRKACAAITSSDPPSRNAPHTVVRVIPRASYDWGGDTRTHAPAPIPAIQPSTIATLYTLSGGTGYGEESMSAHHREEPRRVPGHRARLLVPLDAGEALEVVDRVVHLRTPPSVHVHGVAALDELLLQRDDPAGAGLPAFGVDLARVQRVRGLAGHGLDRPRGVAVVAEMPGRAQEREVGDVLELHEELLSSRKGGGRGGSLDGLAAGQGVDLVAEFDVPPGALGGDVVAVEVERDIPPGLIPDRGHARRDRPYRCVMGCGPALEVVVVAVALRVAGVPGAALDAGEERDAPALDHLVRGGAVVAVPVGDEPRHDRVEVLPVRAPVVEGDCLQFTGEAALLVDATGAEVLRLVPLDRVRGGGCRDRGAADGRHRDWRGGITFSRKAHRALRPRTNLAVSRQPVRLLPRLDLRDRARADLPVHSRANNTLHSRVIEQPLMLHLVQRGDVTEVPVLAHPSPLIPAPPVQATIALEPILDRRR